MPQHVDIEMNGGKGMYCPSGDRNSLSDISSPPGIAGGLSNKIILLP